MPSDAKIFNPLSLDALQRILREELEAQPRQAFPLTRFTGPGVYALYYVGSTFMPYVPLAGTDVPVYVGKASAGDSSYGDPASAQGLKLFNRVGNHASSIKQASHNLSITDFEARVLVVDDAWIVLTERALLRAYRPVLWNTLVRGFGANPSGGDRRNPRSTWDTVHPGRNRAGRLCNRLWTLEEILQHVKFAVNTSLLPDGSERETAVSSIRGMRYPTIWERNKKTSGIIVWDRRRFNHEMDRLSLTRPSEIEYGDPASTPMEGVEDDGLN
jgi:hypothetical protein